MVEVDLIFARAEDFLGLPQRNVESTGQNMSREYLERQGIAFVSFGLISSVHSKKVFKRTQFGKLVLLPKSSVVFVLCCPSSVRWKWSSTTVGNNREGSGIGLEGHTVGI